MVFFTKPIYNQDFYNLLELWDSYKSQMALVIQLKLQQENKIPAEVTAEQMNRIELNRAALGVSTVRP